MTILSRTHFHRRSTQDQGWQWYHRTESPNGQPIGVGGEGYDERNGAVNGFLSTQGYPGWHPGQPLPEGYKEEKFADDHYVITHFSND